MSSKTDVLAVALFGQFCTAEVTKNRCNWKVSWLGHPIDTFVPVRRAINARDAAMQAARQLESLKWGNRVLMASLRGAVGANTAMSTELALWITAKADGRDFDRHARVNPAEVATLARAALQGVTE